MKIKVVTEFIDKYTGELHLLGEEMEVSVQRVNEILSAGTFISIVEEAPIRTEKLKQIPNKKGLNGHE